MGVVDARAATLLAQKLYVPDATIVLEDGVIAPQPSIPMDPIMEFVSTKSSYRAVAWTDLNTVCSHASSGFYDYGVLQTLQVDPFGNINSSFLGGTYSKPVRRYGGAGGANEIASLCWRTILLTVQEKRKFVKKLDFISSPGFLDGSPNAREKHGLPADTGPYRVITPEAIFGYDEKTRYMTLLAIAEWVEVQDVLDKMDFEPIIASNNISRIPLPLEEELDTLRVYVDPIGKTISEGKWLHL